MTPETLEGLFNRYGYILVWNSRQYSAFQPCDIEGEQVRPGACAFCSFSTFALDEVTPEQALSFMMRAGTSQMERTPFDTNYTYTVGLPKRKPLPEWNGWPVEKLREILGIDKQEG